MLYGAARNCRILEPCVSSQWRTRVMSGSHARSCPPRSDCARQEVMLFGRHTRVRSVSTPVLWRSFCILLCVIFRAGPHLPVRKSRPQQEHTCLRYQRIPRQKKFHDEDPEGPSGRRGRTICKHRVQVPARHSVLRACKVTACSSLSCNIHMRACVRPSVRPSSVSTVSTV